MRILHEPDRRRGVFFRSYNFFYRGNEQSENFCLYLQPRKDDKRHSVRGRQAGISPFCGDFGEMPEWSIGPHSKCGVRVTVPGVRIPLSPRRTNRSEGWFFFLIRGKVQEWLNWPAWKASKPLKGFRGSNPLLSASRQGESPRTEVRGLFYLFGTRPESVGRHPQPAADPLPRPDRDSCHIRPFRQAVADRKQSLFPHRPFDTSNGRFHASTFSDGSACREMPAIADRSVLPAAAMPPSRRSRAPARWNARSPKAGNTAAKCSMISDWMDS